MSGNHRVIPIYTTSGTLGAYLKYPYLYNLQGEWIGWVSADRQVYSVHDNHVGWLTDGPRIVRNRAVLHSRPRRTPPLPPPSIRPPATVPLPPLMRELAYGEVDVLDEEPDRLPTVDSGELREDMD